jgi:hypothetical protein
LINIICTDAKSEDDLLAEAFPSIRVYGSDQISTWEAFSLLSNSDELIASNSTYSWWAGLLVERGGGIVKVPSPWTLTPIYGDDYLNFPKFLKLPADFETFKER